MTTDKIEIKDDTGENTADAGQPSKPAPGAGNLDTGNQQPPQPQQRTESHTAVPGAATDDDVGLPVGYKGKSPGNGG